MIFFKIYTIMMVIKVQEEKFRRRVLKIQIETEKKTIGSQPLNTIP